MGAALELANTLSVFVLSCSTRVIVSSSEGALAHTINCRSLVATPPPAWTGSPMTQPTPLQQYCCTERNKKHGAN